MVIVLVLIGVIKISLNQFKEKQVEQKTQEITDIKKSLESSLVKSSLSQNWPATFSHDNKEFKISYTFDHTLTSFIENRLKFFRSDFAAVVVMDNDTGNVLAAVGYNKDKKQFDNSLVFLSTHPSASLFKIITSAELLENSNLGKNDMFNFIGRGTTLYKYQLQEKRNKWSRLMSFKDAFAFSNNVIFGKAAMNHSNAVQIFDMAKNFGFNQPLINELKMVQSKIDVADDQYNLAEIASGFNTNTLISPIHAALMSSVIANHGILRQPRIVDSVTEINNEQYIWKNISESKRILSARSGQELESMMALTITKGTARSSFRKMNKKLKEKLIIGGKTGSITGGFPEGKRDWFTVFAKPAEGNSKGISISVMNINVEQWFVRSAAVAHEIINFYYNDLKR